MFVELLLFCLEQQCQKCSFLRGFFTSKKITSSSLPTRTITSRKYLAEQGMNIPKVLQRITYFGYSPPFFLYSTSLKNATFPVFLPQKSYWWLLSLKSVHSIPENM